LSCHQFEKKKTKQQVVSGWRALDGYKMAGEPVKTPHCIEKHRRRRRNSSSTLKTSSSTTGRIAAPSFVRKSNSLKAQKPKEKA